MILSLVTVATTATNWLVVAKVLTAVGSGMLTAAPAIEAMKSAKRERKV